MRTFSVLRFVLGVALVALALPVSAQASFPGQNGKMLFNDAFGLAVIDADGTSNQTQILSNEGVPQNARWSADGKSIVFVGYLDDVWSVAAADADGANVRQILADQTGSVFQPAFSPDGAHVVFAATLDGQAAADLYVVPTAGGTPQRITLTNYNVATPVWSPDGKTIAFQAFGADALPGVYTIDVSNLASPGVPVRRSAIGVQDNGPEWSPDGAWLYVNSGVHNGLDRMSPDGSGRQTLVDVGNSVVIDGPHVSPDGTKLAYRAGNGEEGYQAHIASSDGSNPVPVTAIGDWQPVTTPPALGCPAVPPKGLVGPIVYGLGNALKLQVLKQLACALGGL